MTCRLDLENLLYDDFYRDRICNLVFKHNLAQCQRTVFSLLKSLIGNQSAYYFQYYLSEELVYFSIYTWATETQKVIFQICTIQWQCLFFLIQVFCTLNIYSALDKFNNFCLSLPPPQESYKYIKMIILESDFYFLFIQDHIQNVYVEESRTMKSRVQEGFSGIWESCSFYSFSCVFVSLLFFPLHKFSVCFG